MRTSRIRSAWASMQAFRRSRAATRGLIAAPWTPLAFSVPGWKGPVTGGGTQSKCGFPFSFSLPKES